jgi:plastocyanin
MRKTNVLVSLSAAGALILGSIGMASATQQSHADHESHGIVGEDASQASRHTTGALPVLRGKVDAARNITLSDTTPSPGRYKIVVNDSTASHNWHLFGNGLDRATSVSGTGRSVFRVRFSAGTYTVHCDIHQSSMHFSVQVG